MAREVVGMEISRVVIVVCGSSSVEGWERAERKGVCLLVGKKYRTGDPRGRRVRRGRARKREGSGKSKIKLQYTLD